MYFCGFCAFFKQVSSSNQKIAVSALFFSLRVDTFSQILALLTMSFLPIPVLMLRCILLFCESIQFIIKNKEQQLECQKRQLCELLVDHERTYRLPKKKRRYVNYDRIAASACIQRDYLGPVPIFNDQQFQRMFRISKSVYHTIKRELQSTNAFFSSEPTANAVGLGAIGCDAKLLIALKGLAYGTSVNSFRDYYQMGESTANKSLHEFIKSISENELLNSIYLRGMTRTDAKRVCERHKAVHGIPGMVGSLDCLHIPWKNCPVAYQGTFHGSKEKPTIILEASADYDLWFWHASFGHPGALNDINVLNASSLHAAYLNGSCERQHLLSLERLIE